MYSAFILLDLINNNWRVEIMKRLIMQFSLAVTMFTICFSIKKTLEIFW
jgi:hypothetical protein